MRINCLATSCEPVNSSVYQAILQPCKHHLIDFQAGQYLNVYHSDGKCSSFSIASSPSNDSHIELHIHRHDSTEPILQLMENNQPVTIELPFGDCVLPQQPVLKSDAPLIFIAAGTGYSQMQSMLLELLNSPANNPVYLYWGVRQAEGFYLLDQIEQWKKQHQHFRFIPVVSDATENCQWLGREGLLHEAVIEDFKDFGQLQDAKLYIGGSPLMVYATLDVLMAHGLQESQASSDVFSYAPRSKA